MYLNKQKIVNIDSTKPFSSVRILSTDSSYVFVEEKNSMYLLNYQHNLMSSTGISLSNIYVRSQVFMQYHLLGKIR